MDLETATAVTCSPGLWLGIRHLKTSKRALDDDLVTKKQPSLETGVVSPVKEVIHMLINVDQWDAHPGRIMIR